MRTFHERSVRALLLVYSRNREPVRASLEVLVAAWRPHNWARPLLVPLHAQMRRLVAAAAAELPP